MNRKDLLNILNVGEEKYIIDDMYDQVELDVEVVRLQLTLAQEVKMNEYMY